MVETNAALFENSHLLVSVMGRWPSFHDANVTDVVRNGNVCRTSIHVFEMTDQIDPNGYYVLTKHHLVTIEMSGITESTLPAHYESDVLFGLSATRVGKQVKVVFDSVIDPDRTWHVICEQATVIEVVPCGPHGGAALLES